MKIVRKLLLIALPFVLAGCLLLGFFYLPIGGGVSEGRLRTAASAMGDSIIKGNLMKNEAAADPLYIPFFGSSELRRFDAFHPSILAEKYDREYRPFLLGTAGTQSIVHALSIHSMGQAAEGKQAVFIISPQWFQREGVSAESLENFFSPIQTYDWICDADVSQDARRYLAKRLLSFTFIQENPRLHTILGKLAAGEPLTAADEQFCEKKLRRLQAEDRFYGQFFPETYRHRIRSEMKKLPNEYDPEELDRLAYSIGLAASKNNEFQIINSFYSSRIKSNLKQFKNRQKNISYEQSPEYADFELVLEEMAKKNMDVLFVITPVNRRWADFTGLRQSMYEQFADKITTQLNEQGFHRVLDLSKRGGENYFMEDTIHIGWRGWVAMDQAVIEFLGESSPRPAPAYTINPYYYSEEWCLKTPT